MQDPAQRQLLRYVPRVSILDSRTVCARRVRRHRLRPARHLHVRPGDPPDRNRGSAAVRGGMATVEMVTLALVGAGLRGQTYARHAVAFGRARVVAVAE